MMDPLDESWSNIIWQLHAKCGAISEQSWDYTRDYFIVVISEFTYWATEPRGYCSEDEEAWQRALFQLCALGDMFL